MTAVFVDTDVLLDVVLKRPEFYPASFQIVQWIEQKKLAGYVSPMTINNMYYFMRKESSHAQALLIIEKVMLIFNVASIDKYGIVSALNSAFKDFEDALQNFSALQHSEIDTIITRNIKDYRSSNLSIMTPTEYTTYFHTRFGNANAL